MAEITLMQGRVKLDAAVCDTEDKLYPENDQSSRRPYHIYEYCYRWAEMEDPNYCMNEACMKKRKEKDNEIMKLRVR